MKRPFVTAIEGLAGSLAQTGGAINAPVQGWLVRSGGGGERWDMEQEWKGPEVSGYLVRNSLWDKSIRIMFTGGAGDQRTMPLFTLTLLPPMTPEDIEQTAQTYVILLNLRRKTDG